MKVSVLVLAGAAIATTPLHAEVARTPAHCADRTGMTLATDRAGIASAAADRTGAIPAADGPARWQRLDRLPPAAEILTVFRTVDGCPTPVVVRYGIGAAAKGGR